MTIRFRRPAVFGLTAATLLGIAFTTQFARLSGDKSSSALSAAPPVIRPRVIASAGKPKRLEHDAWYVIQLGGQRIGHSHVLAYTLVRDGRKVFQTVKETSMTFKRFGKPIKMFQRLETEEDEHGNLLSFVLKMKNPPASSARTVGRVDGTRMVIESSVAGQQQKRTVNWTAGTKSPDYLERWFTETKLKPGQTRKLQTYSPDLGRTSTLRVTVDRYRTVKLFDGTFRKALLVQIDDAPLPTLRAYLDETGQVLATETNLLGKVMATYRVASDEALEEVSGSELDIAVNTLIRVKPIPRAHESKRIVYRITISGEGSNTQLPEGPTQSIVLLDKNLLDLTVTALPVPVRSALVRTAPEFLKPTRFLQSDDPRVIEHARAASAGLTRPSKIAVAMEKYVYRRLSKKNFSTALGSAAEVARSLEGDCTEHAVLLAAMLRHRKIPSRVVVGLVYVEGLTSFGGHMWTEAWLNGKWIPLDATLGRGGIGAAHIKLADSSFADDAPIPVTSFLPLLNVLGRMRIEVLEVE